MRSEGGNDQRLIQSQISKAQRVASAEDSDVWCVGVTVFVEQMLIFHREKMLET